MDLCQLLHDGFRSAEVIYPSIHPVFKIYINPHIGGRFQVLQVKIGRLLSVLRDVGARWRVFHSPHDETRLGNEQVTAK